VITSVTSSLPEVAGDSALLVDPGDTNAIADAMKRISANSQLRKSLIERGAINIHRFSWTTCAQTILGIFERFVV